MNKQLIIGAVICLGLGIGLGALLFYKKDNTAIAPFCAKDGALVFACAMHPQVKQGKRGQCPLCGMHLTTQLAKTYINKALLQLEKDQVALAGIQTKVLGSEQSASLEVALTGKIQADESRVYMQVAHLPGRIDRLFINEPGVFVKKGQRIASVYSKELIAVVEAFEYSKNSSSVVRSAENNLINWKVSDAQLAEFDIKGNDYRKHVDVFADFSGFVTKKFAKEGDLAVNTHMGSPTAYFEVADLSRVWVTFEVPERWSGQVAVGDLVQFEVIAFPGESWQGRVAVVDPMVDKTRRTLGIRLEVNNPGFRLKPEMLVKGILKGSSERAQAGLLIPDAAVLWTGKQSVVYVQSGDYSSQVFEYRQIELGQYLGGYYEVLQGVDAGERVVVSGALKVDAAAQLSGRNSVFNKGLAEIKTE